MWRHFLYASVLKNKKRKCISSSGGCHNQSCPICNSKDVKAPLLAFKDEFRNLFFTDVYEILWSAFECIESDSIFKSAIKKSTLMQVTLLASMRIEVGFDQDPSMNGIIVMIVCRNLFNDPDDDSEGFVSFFVTLEDATLSLQWGAIIVG